MRVTLPGGVAVNWSPDQVAEAIHVLTDTLAASITATTAVDTARLDVSSPPFVRYGDLQTTLPGKQFLLLQLVVNCGGSASFTDAEEVVWFGQDTSDETIGRTVRRVSAALSVAGFPCSLSPAGGTISLEFL